MEHRCFDPTKAQLIPPLPGNLTADIDLDGKQYDGDEAVRLTKDLNEANVILSKMDLPEGVEPHHRPVLDIDLEAILLPSSKPGHFHLYLDKPMTWPVYRALLIAMKDAGLLEEGYVNAALRRGYTAVRLPWIKKGSK